MLYLVFDVVACKPGLSLKLVCTGAESMPARIPRFLPDTVKRPKLTSVVEANGPVTSAVSEMSAITIIMLNNNSSPSSTRHGLSTPLLTSMCKT